MNEKNLFKPDWMFPLIIGTVNTLILIGGLYGSYIANTVHIQETANTQAKEINALRQDLNNNLALRRQEADAIQARQQTFADNLVNDRATAVQLNNSLSIRLAAIEQDIKYMQRDIGEIRETLGGRGPHQHQ